ncbi:hypothetical protein ACQR1I_12010 [Bradyrhizobium sp. HKCCYLS2038]|uniref:hypothetical protein n=1 Tax=unclassified Bradyrhizobium TaxID=2631580 RepID=UPI003EB70212
MSWLDRVDEPGSKDELPPLALANLVAAEIERRPRSMDREAITGRILHLAATCERIDLERLREDINADRAACGLPSVTNPEALSGALEGQRRYFARVMRDLVDGLPTGELIDTVYAIISRSTRYGTCAAPRLVSDLAAIYEREAQPFMAGEMANADRLIARIRAEAAQRDSRMTTTIDALDRVASNWTRVMRPMQLLQRANGVDHATSSELALRMRSLAIWLCNDQRMIDAMRRIYAILRREFGLLADLSARLEQDLAPAPRQAG